MRFWSAVIVASLLLAAPAAQAKKFRYASGPKPSTDTTFSVAQVEITPVVRSRGPRVAATNLQMTAMVANEAVLRAMRTAPLDSGGHVVVAPAESHPLNFLMEHAVLRELSRRGVTATIRRSLIPDDSVGAVPGGAGDPVLEYQLASARVTYLRLVGGYVLPSRTQVERQALVEGALSLRDPASSRVLWVGEAAHNLVDVFPRGQLKLVEDERFSDLKGTVPERDLGKFVEPVVVVGVVSGLIVLFFQNRP
jgi:hypothetical protein